MRGEDVALLQTELTQLHEASLLNADIDPDEVGRRFFGTTTRQAVTTFQGQHGRDVTGQLDEVTARRINAEVDGLGSDTDRYVVRGRLHQNGRTAVGGLARDHCW